MRKLYFGNLIAVAIILTVIILLWLMQDQAGRNRYVPSPRDGEGIVVVRTQKDAYHVLKSLQVRGAIAISLSKYFNLLYWVPENLAKSTPFPVEVFDVRTEYERGLDSHNWLFIASRTGLVRQVWTVLSPEELQRLSRDLDADYGLRSGADGYRGFHYDLPRRVTTMERLPRPDGPHVVVVDASYFQGGVEPAETARQLLARLADKPFLIVVSSLDEAELTWQMRRNLALFITAWQERG